MIHGSGATFEIKLGKGPIKIDTSATQIYKYLVKFTSNS